MSDLSFAYEKERFLRLARVLEKANSPAQLRSLLVADTDSPLHSYDMLELMTEVECIGIALAELMSHGLDEHGAPA